MASEIRQSLRKSFGGDNPVTLAMTANVAIVRRRQERWTEAADIARDAWIRLSRRLGPEHPYTICAANGVAADLRLEGGTKPHGAFPIRASDAVRAPWQVGTAPDWLVLVANAGLDLSADGDEEFGDPMWKAAVHDLTEVLSPKHPVVSRLRARERVDLDIEPPPL